MGGNGNGGSNFATTTIVASLHSPVNVVQKEERENDKQRKTNNNKEKKNAIGALGNRRNRF